MPADLIDLEEARARRIVAAAGPLRFAGAELASDGTTVRLTLPSGHTEELRGAVAVTLGSQLAQLGEWAQDGEDAERDGGLFT